MLNKTAINWIEIRKFMLSFILSDNIDKIFLIIYHNFILNIWRHYKYFISERNADLMNLPKFACQRLSEKLIKALYHQNEYAHKMNVFGYSRSLLHMCSSMSTVDFPLVMALLEVLSDHRSRQFKIFYFLCSTIFWPWYLYISLYYWVNIAVQAMTNFKQNVRWNFCYMG